MARILIIAWFGTQACLMPVGLNIDWPGGASEKCCCCASAAVCQCGCESVPSSSERESNTSLKACDCGDSPAIVTAARTETPDETSAVVVVDSDTSLSRQTSVVRVSPHLRGPPPDLLIVQSTILLI